MANDECRCFVGDAEAQVEYAPWGKHDWLSRPGLTDTKQLLMVRVHMPPGTAHQFHRHPTREELLYVLDGEIEQWVGKEKRTLRAGESAYICMDEVHGSYNTSGRMARFLAVLSPAVADGPMLVEVQEDEPWRSLRVPFTYGPPAKAELFEND